MTALEIAFATLTATLTTKFDELCKRLEPQAADVEARLRVLEADRPDPTHETRLSKLEQWKWTLTGAAIAGGGAAGGIMSAIWQH